MKKELKALIAKRKLSDDDLMTLINAADESDAGDDDESETEPDSEEAPDAESPPAKEKGKKNTLSMADLQKLIVEGVKAAMAPPAKPGAVKAEKGKADPIPKRKEPITIGGFQLVG
jgi:hypothetical protein